jgi:hypothetical protein
MKWIKRNPINAAYFFGFCVCLAIAYPNIKANMAAMGEVQKLTQDNNTKQMRLMATQQFVESQGEIADSRYKFGCIMVVAFNSPDKLTALEEGKPVIDAARQRPLSPGAVVCDGFGSTGLIVRAKDGKPVVGEMAFTGNDSLISSAKKKANKKYSLPRN